MRITSGTAFLTIVPASLVSASWPSMISTLSYDSINQSDLDPIFSLQEIQKSILAYHFYDVQMAK
jgi:hypothetical protein